MNNRFIAFAADYPRYFGIVVDVIKQISKTGVGYVTLYINGVYTLYND